jgi:hypothetical protein
MTTIETTAMIPDPLRNAAHVVEARRAPGMPWRRYAEFSDRDSARRQAELLRLHLDPACIRVRPISIRDRLTRDDRETLMFGLRGGVLRTLRVAEIWGAGRAARVRAAEALRRLRGLELIAPTAAPGVHALTREGVTIATRLAERLAKRASLPNVDSQNEPQRGAACES